LFRAGHFTIEVQQQQTCAAVQRAAFVQRYAKVGAVERPGQPSA
jgi:hypothetical protein